MSYEWDPAKAESNRLKHGVDFEEAKTAFHDPFFVIFEDPNHSTEERRLLLLGQSGKDRLLVVSHTERRGTIRLISARKATKRERNVYEEEI